jgi:hypothetical protein
MSAIDLAAPVLVVVLLAVFFATLVYLRDPVRMGPRAVWRWVWCPRRGRTTMVEFTERVQTGMALRSVRQCPLRREGEPCGEECAWQPTLAP